jgi:tRNA-dihydrouridine synthase 3
MSNSDYFRNVIAMAPMATGGNLPYRRLCKSYGAQLTCSEMVLAHKLVKGSRGEDPLMRQHADEDVFGIQIAGSKEAVMVQAAQMAVERGCDYLDLNFGCPIDLVVRRGSGAAMLKKPAKLASLVAAVREAVDVPLLVKIRTGWTEDKIIAPQLAPRLEEAGADVISIHGRTREQRYRRDADWQIIDEAAAAVSIPVLGNGDILTVWDYRERRENTAVSGVVVARGALIKPWIFKELVDGAPWFPTTAERWGVMRRYFDFAAEHFGDDEKGLGRVQRFFLWHLGFWHRYRPFTRQDWEMARPTSLIQQRIDPIDGNDEDVLLCSADPADHQRIWERLLDKDHPGI